MNTGIEILDRAVQFIYERRAILFLGAGISRIAGCYDWQSIIEEMARHPLISGRIGPDFIDTTSLRNEEKIEYCRQIFYKENRRKDYIGIIRKAVLFNPELFSNAYIPFIKTLKRIEPFPVIITTNCDLCLEYSRLFSPERFYLKKEDFVISNLQEGSVFHIHGSQEDIENAVFSKRQYRSLYSDDVFTSFLQHVFNNYCVIFLGYGLRDEELKNIIFDMNIQDSRFPYFWLVPNGDINPSESQVYLDVYRITVVQYGETKELPEKMRYWINKYFTGNSQITEGTNDER